jgi:hypothetical protein
LGNIHVGKSLNAAEIERKKKLLLWWVGIKFCVI